MNYSKDGITVATVLDTRREKTSGGYPVKIRVTYRRKRTYFQTGKNLSVDEWERLDTTRLHSLVDIRKDIENSFDLVKTAVKDLSEKGEFTIPRLNLRLKSVSVLSVNDLINKRRAELRENGQAGTMFVYTTLLKNLSQFAGDNITFEEVTPDWLKKYENFLRSAGKKQSTIAIGMRTLRAIFNEAKRTMIIKESQYPFGRGRYEIQEGEGRKLALTIEDIGRIARYEPKFEATGRYRDYWLFLYLCNGINVTDMVRLRYEDIVDGEIHFTRQKTQRTSKVHQEIKVVITEPMKAIIEKYGNKDRIGYIFPVLKGGESAERARLKTQYFTKAINKRMAEIAKELDIPHISTYTARHSFATVLKRAGANIAYISESLGHSNIKTTEHYLASFEREEREKNAHILTRF